MLCLIPSTTFVLTPVASWTCAGGAEGGKPPPGSLCCCFRVGQASSAANTELMRCTGMGKVGLLQTAPWAKHKDISE